MFLSISLAFTVFTVRLKKMAELKAGLRHNGIKNTISKIKHIQVPCLVHTDTLFDKDRGLSLQE